MKYGLLLNDAAMLTVNVVAIILNLIYTILYYNFSENKQEEIFKPLSIGAALVAVFLGYAQIESPQNIEYRYGLMLTILMLLLLGSPLLDVVINLKYFCICIIFKLTLFLEENNCNKGCLLNTTAIDTIRIICHIPLVSVWGNPSQ